MEVPDAVKFQEKGLENVELLDIMFKDIAATGELAWALISSVLPDDIETRKEGLGEMSTYSSSPDNNDDVDLNEVETPNPNTRQRKEVSFAIIHRTTRIPKIHRFIPLREMAKLASFLCLVLVV
uniref:Uncharacterized protein n=1 Tax=Quercus lobata TaxID=97700 RepID=A0A7N2LPX3_QUELO